MPSKETLVPRPLKSRLPQIVGKHEAVILTEWMTRQLAVVTMRSDLVSESELRDQSKQFLAAFSGALQSGDADPDRPGWEGVRGVVENLSASRARMGFSPAETAMFVFSLREPLFTLMRRELGDDAQALADETSNVSTLLDKLGLWTIESYQKTREEVIARQQQELLELSTPVVTLWSGVLALPLIGTLDSARTQVVMENLLSRLSSNSAEIAIIDITGVPTVDTLVAQHLLKTVAAARLMGAECIISGIRPQIAQTIVHLGVELGNVITKATLADAFAIALQRTGRKVVANGTAGAATVARNGSAS